MRAARQNGGTERQTDKPFSSSELPKLAAVLCQPTAWVPVHPALPGQTQRYVECMHHISIRHRHFFQISLMNCSDFCQWNQHLGNGHSCFWWGEAGTSLPKRCALSGAAGLRRSYCGQVPSGLLFASCHGLYWCHLLSAVRSKGYGATTQAAESPSMVDRTSGVERQLLLSPLLFRQWGGWGQAHS